MKADEPGTGEAMRISREGLILLKEFEGLRLKEYIDAGGYLSIGYGHLLQDGERFENGITLEEAENMLIADVADAESVVESMVTVDLSQNQFDALVSFVYNIGGDQFSRSTMLRLLNSGDYSGAAKQFKRWNKSSGKVLKALVTRRAKEEALFGAP